MLVCSSWDKISEVAARMWHVGRLGSEMPVQERPMHKCSFVFAFEGIESCFAAASVVCVVF